MSREIGRPVWRKSENLAVAESEGGGRFAVLDLDLDGSQPVVLADSAAGIWRALAEPGTAAEVADRVAADYGMPASEIADQVGGFLESLRTQGLARTD
ncbi:hypothetical protein GCM10023081_08810 [Arthrobacter ginkgonis]|uniref:PqqD family protein n=1 Tax=Arthrobacter ginkgonis TaxID=1630594 RepID=A0ABP7C0P4_9MICC